MREKPAPKAAVAAPSWWAVKIQPKVRLAFSAPNRSTVQPDGWRHGRDPVETVEDREGREPDDREIGEGQDDQRQAAQSINT